MAYLIHIGLALLAQVAWEEGLLESTMRLWLVLLLLFVPHLLAQLTHRLYLRGRFRVAERAHALLVLSPVLLHTAAVFAGGWIEVLETWSGRSARLLDWPTPILLATLLPLVVYTLLAIDARARIGGGARARVRSTFRFQTRLFAASLLPLAGYVLLSWAVGSIPHARLNIETVALWNAAYAASMLLIFAASVPWLLRNTWETEALAAGPERALLEGVAQLSDFRCRKLFVWRTGQSVANAAIIGLFPRQRVVLFSDLLLAQLDLRQLASVFAHEIGHAKKNHVVIFAAWAFAALFAADLAGVHFFPEDAHWAAALLAGSMVVWALVFGWMSRRFELQADLYSLRLLGDPTPLIQALEEVGGAHSRARTSWRHFSVERRVQFLEAVSREPSVGERLDRRLRWLARLGLVAFFLVMALEARGLVQQWPRDQVLLDLREGDYRGAARRVAEGADLDQDLTLIVAQAAELELGDLTELEKRARASISSGDLPAAGRWLDLGALRGSRDMAQVRAFLSSAQEDARPSQEALSAALPATWRDALAPFLRSLGP